MRISVLTFIGVLWHVAFAQDAGPPCSSGAYNCQIHVAIGTKDCVNGEKSLRFSWISVGGANPVVQWSTNAVMAEGFSFSAVASSETYELSDMCVPSFVDMPVLRGWEDPGTIHHVEIVLPEGQVIFYRVGDSLLDQFSDTIGPIQVGPKRGEGLTSFVVFGDMGTYEYAPAVAAAETLGACDDLVATSLARVAPSLDAVLVVGDLAYAHDGPASRWRYWMEEVEETSKIVPWMVGCGNHDCLWGPNGSNPNIISWEGAVLTSGTDGGQCAVPYNARYWMPGNVSLIDDWHEGKSGRNNLFYSFDIGYVHMVMLSAEHALDWGSVQHDWLISDLEVTNRTETPFVVIGLHRPVYTSTNASQLPESIGLRGAIEPLALKYRVTAVLAGHYHQYERSCRVAREKCVGDEEVGVVYVTAGIAGITHSAPWLAEKPEWVVVQDTESHGYLRFDTINRTHMQATAVNALNNDETFDSFWLLA